MANKNNLFGSSTVQFRSLTPDWLMNLKLAGSLIPEDKASQAISISFSLRQEALLSKAL